MLKFTKFFILILLSCGLFACGFHPPGNDSLPPKLRCLYLKSGNPYGRFEANLKKALAMVGVTLVNNSQEAPVTLQILQTTLFSLPSSVGTSSQATVYTVTYQVTMQLLDANGNVLVGPRNITSSTTMIINAQQQLNSTDQLDTLSEQLQQDDIRQIFGILSSEQVREAMERKINRQDAKKEKNKKLF